MGFINKEKGLVVFSSAMILFLPYIECVEFDENGKPMPYSITGRQWGQFLCDIYDEWIKKDTRRVSIRIFDSLLTYMADGARIVCKMGLDCRQYLVVEYNGDIYPCDFFVEKELKIGNIMQGSWEEFQGSKVYEKFGNMKTEWNSKCTECEYIAYCSGDCLKSRFYSKRDPGQISWLCEGWQMVHKHILPGLRDLARQIRNEREQPATMTNQDSPQRELAPEKTEPVAAAVSKKIGRNHPCPCGSGKKYKNCCLGAGGPSY